jgi:GT2 family glycosyltransferase
MMLQLIDFSVIIPTFNRPTQLADCLRALAEQDYPADRFEVIVVDDGSESPVHTLILPYRNSINITALRTANGGPGAARNHGARIARGRFLAFTDDDCAPSTGWLSALMTTFRASPEALTGGGIRNALIENPFSAASQLILDFVHDYSRRQPESLRFFSSNNIALASRLFRELDGFNLQFRTSEDRDLCDRWSESGRQFVFAPEALVHHSNDLSFRSFWRQHLGYGRGARMFYMARRSRRPGEATIRGGFYLALLHRLPVLIMQQKRHQLILPLLMVVWQAANLAGFLQEALCKKSITKGGKS